MTGGVHGLILPAVIAAVALAAIIAMAAYEIRATRAHRARAERVPVMPLSDDFIARMRSGDVSHTHNAVRRYFGLPVIESEHVPPGTFIGGAFGTGGTWEPAEPLSGLLRLSQPLWEPSRFDNRAAFGMGGEATADVATRERAAALDHLAGLLDGLCDRHSIDREVWRSPRRAATARAAYETGLVRYRAEARLAFTIHRPETFAVITGL